MEKKPEGVHQAVLIDANEVCFPPGSGLHACPQGEDEDMVWFRNIRCMACYGCVSLWTGIEGEVLIAVYAKHFNLKEEDWPPSPTWQRENP